MLGTLLDERRVDPRVAWLPVGDRRRAVALAAGRVGQLAPVVEQRDLALGPLGVGDRGPAQAITGAVVTDPVEGVAIQQVQIFRACLFRACLYG